MRVCIRAAVLLSVLFSSHYVLYAEETHIVADEASVCSVSDAGIDGPKKASIDMLECLIIYNGQWIEPNSSTSTIPPYCYNRYRFGSSMMRTGFFIFTANVGSAIGYIATTAILGGKVSNVAIWTFGGLAAVGSALYLTGFLNMRKVVNILNSQNLSSNERIYMNFGLQKDGTIGLAVNF